jgi:hypothetical protein
MILTRQRPRRRTPFARRTAARAPAPAPGPVSPTVIPYDYSASFELTGREGNLVQDVINISPDGVFVAVAIGYGFEEDRTRPLALVPGPSERVVDGVILPGQPSTPLPGDVTLGKLPPSALIGGFRLNPRFEPLVLGKPNGASAAGAVVAPPGLLAGLDDFSDRVVPPHLLEEERGETLSQRLKAPEEVFFLLSIVDSSSGRELQDRPSHNLASLGLSNGQRPFRLLAHPVAFLPRSTIRLQITEQSRDVRGTLFIVLFGYKLLGASHCPENVMRRLTGPPACPVETIGSPSARVIPFDHVTTFELTGRPGNFVESEVPVSAEGGFIATVVGYGLAVPEQRVLFQWERVPGIETKVQSLDPNAPPKRSRASSAVGWPSAETSRSRQCLAW